MQDRCEVHVGLPTRLASAEVRHHERNAAAHAWPFEHPCTEFEPERQARGPHFAPTPFVFARSVMLIATV